MQQHQLWQLQPPPASAFESQQPFALDTMEATEWLQWIFIPRMSALIEAEAPLPTAICDFALSGRGIKRTSAFASFASPNSKN